MADRSGASPDALPLPKGGGSTRGLGDAFTPDLNRGTGSYSVEIETPKGYRTLAPTLALSYNSSNGDGPFGLGWGVNLPRIQLDSDRGVADYLKPSFLLEGETLLEMGSGRYRPRVENAFHRVRRVGDGWELTDKTGGVTLLGDSPASRVSGAVFGEERDFAWLASNVRDTSGNELRYEYLRDGGNLYLAAIRYAVFEILFDYEERHDVTSSRRPGFALTQRLRCRTIEVRRPADSHPLIRRYELHYAPGRSAPSLLTRVEMHGFKRQADGSILTTTAPVAELEYTPFEPHRRRFAPVRFAGTAPPTLDGGAAELVDLNGDGLPDLLSLGAGRPRVWRNLGVGRFSAGTTLQDFPAPLLLEGRTALLDADGSASADLLVTGVMAARYYPNAGDGSFTRPRPFGGDRAVAFDPSDADTRVTDFDGDGRVDVVKTTARGLLAWRNGGAAAGFAEPTVVPRGHDRDALPDVRLSAAGVFVADMTGDGLPDLVHVADGLVEYWPALGGGRYDRRRRMTDPPQLPRRYEPQRLFLADVDGAGAADLIYVDHHRVLIWRNLGGVFFAAPLEVAGTPYGSPDSLRLVDLHATGTVGVLWSDVRGAGRSGYRYLALSDTKPYLLTRIRESIGLETTIAYGSSSAHAARDERRGASWQTRLPMPVPVVDRITRTDLVSGNDDETELFYHEGRWDPEARRFRGFGRVVVRRTGDAESGEVFEEHRHLVGVPGEPAIGVALDRQLSDRARRGQLYLSSFAEDLGGPALRTEATHWEARVLEVAADGQPVLFPHVVATVVSNAEAGTHPRVVTTAYSYDAFGNVTRERREGSAPSGDDAGGPVETLAVVTEVDYAVDTQRYVVDRVARMVRRDDAGRVLAEMRHYYDGPDFVGLPLGQVERGLLTRQEEIVLPRADAAALYGAREPDWTELGYHVTTRVDGVPALAANPARYAHSAAGMIVARRDALGAETAYGYDPDGLLVERLTDAVGHTRTARYDRSWQLLEAHTAPDGGESRYSYDGLGRVLTVIRPGDTPARPTLRYTHDHSALPNSVIVEKRRSADEVYVRAVYFDGRGREAQVRSRIDGDSVRVTGVVEVNRRGDAVFKGLPQRRTGLAYEPPDALPATNGYRYRYDASGRLVSATNLDGQEARVGYTPWSAAHSDVIDTNPAHPHAGTPRVEHFDAFGRLAGVSRHGTGGAIQRASYRYDLLGRLVATTDLEARTAFRAVVYDGRGARLELDHATAGVRTAVYDASRRLVAYWDDRGEVVERTFDAIGRQLTESVGGIVTETYRYDADPAQRGRLSSVDDEAGTVRFTYDRRGRVIAKQRTILGQTYELAYGYDSADLQASVTYPDAGTVTFDRWGDGRVRSVSGFVDTLDYDDLGRLTGVHHSNGVAEALGYDASGWLSTMRFTRGADDLFSAHLTHDAAGRLTDWQDLLAPAAEHSEYDVHGCLQRFERRDGGATTAFEYEHDADGNLLRADEMSIAGYHYDFTQPGGLRRLELSDGTFRELSFDVAGQLNGVGDDAFEFDARGRLTRVTKADGTVAEMVYDYRGARVAKRATFAGGVALTRYVDELFEERAGIANGYVFAAGRLVGRLRGGGRRHLHADHRGSVVVVSRPDGGVDGRGWFHPFGDALGFADADGSRQFTGGVFDPETGLYYFNLRFYDPELGRFLSPDPRFLGRPERELGVPETHNLYAYAGGDPLNYVDPTGQGFWSTLGKVVAAIVVVAAVVAAAAVIVHLIAAAAGVILLGAAIGAVIGGIADGWRGAALGAMMGATIGINFAVGGPLGIVTFLGVFPGIREQSWYHSLAGWTSWIMPASWPGHIMGLGIFLGNGIAHVFGSDKQIESMKFDWKHGQILTAGGEYGGSPFPFLGFNGPSHNVGGFTFWSNDTWAEGGKTWQGIESTVDPGRGFAHETGHMLSNALFGFWQGIINGIENLTTSGHDDRLFEQVAQSNVPAADRDPGDQVIPIWT